MARYFTRKKLYQWAVVFLAIVAALVVVAMIPTRKNGSPRAHCIMNQRNLQQAVRHLQEQEHLQPGDPIPWEKIYGDKDKSLIGTKPACPIQGDFTFATVIPARGTQVARCSHPEHQHADTADW